MLAVSSYYYDTSFLNYSDHDDDDVNDYIEEIIFFFFRFIKFAYK